VSVAQIQSAGFLLELSPDWLVLRASCNAHGFLGHYHQRLVGDPISSFTMAQPLHDLRNSLARQRSSSGIARAYRVRLFDQPERFDFAFQSVGSTILLEGLASAEDGVGDFLGSVSRLIEGVHGSDRKRMLEGATRRMRALTGFDRATLTIGDERVESARGSMAELNIDGELPAIVVNAAEDPVALFPDRPDDLVSAALLRTPTGDQLESLRSAGISSVLRVPVTADGEIIGHFECDNRNARPPSFELHAAAELFAQVLGMLL
jgi:light-regulated signal transduction histidine kinase (bacteriophytochrome)